MKKLFTLFAICFAFFAVNAQVTVILEAHDVWQDGSGYQLLLDADATAYGDIIPDVGPLSTSGNVSATVYSEFEYKIPENADGNLSTSNIVYDGTETITIPAGTYDFCITNPTPGDRMWIASGDYGRYDDFIFESGKTYHFTVSLNQSTGNDMVDLEITDGVGLNEQSTEVFTIYPNPATTSIKVTGEGNAVISNILGQTVTSATVNGVAEINVSNLESGVYFINMNGVSKKFIKK